MKKLTWVRYICQLLLPFALLATLTGCLNSNPMRDYIGLEYLKVSQGLVDNGGWVVDLEQDLVVSDISKGKTRMLWLEQVYREGNAIKYYKVLDVIILPRITHNELLVGRMAMFHYQVDPRIIAIARFNESDHEREYLKVVRHAWKVEVWAKKIRPIKTEGIVCINEGYGI